ncbi:MAG TPA: hypothetical protein PKA77_14965 [Chitinophagaceae bacterium]|jgi:hypothetical protein|nr:hypothetical protein [Chitinophagaceae bacterium]HMU58212.1 hypothetical protein [Chitinophagaceae bacterium]
MKKLLTSFLILVAATVQAQTPSVDEIIASYAKAIGGIEALNKVTSMKSTGSVAMQGMDLPMTSQIIFKKGIRIDVEVMGQSVIRAYGNGKGWEINPFGGKPTATEMTGDDLLEMKEQINPVDKLIDYKNLGHKVELVGEETFEGTKGWNIKFTHKETGKTSNYLISAADYMLVKTTGKKELMGQQVDEQTVYSNIKEFGGLKFPTMMAVSFNGNLFQEVSISNIELNVPVDEKIFNE